MSTLRVTDARAAEIAAREQAATAGPWSTDPDATPVRSRICYHSGVGSRVLAVVNTTTNIPANATFIAHARADIPDLLADRAELIAAAREAAEALVGARDRLLAAGGYTALPDRDAVSLALARLAALGIVLGGTDEH